MKVLVCGSRTYADYETIRRHLARLPRDSSIIHGAARGADQLAATAARSLGFEERAFPADWRGQGKRAGIIRNLQMLDEGPQLVIAFWDGRSTGTKHTIDEAKRRGITVKVVFA